MPHAYAPPPTLQSGFRVTVMLLCSSCSLVVATKVTIIIGASLSEPHINGTSAVRVCYTYICIYYLSYVSQRGPGGPNSSHAAAPATDVVTRGSAGRPIAMCMIRAVCVYDIRRVLQLAGLLRTVLLRTWILQDLRRTEMRGYGVGGNEKGHATLPKRPNKGNAD